MNTETVRLNITLPKDLVQDLNELSEHRKRSRFITDAIRQMVEQKRKEKLERALEEGYRNNKKESLVLSKEFEDIDLEGWDEY